MKRENQLRNAVIYMSAAVHGDVIIGARWCQVEEDAERLPLTIEQGSGSMLDGLPRHPASKTEIRLSDGFRSLIATNSPAQERGRAVLALSRIGTVKRDVVSHLKCRLSVVMRCSGSSFSRRIFRTARRKHKGGNQPVVEPLRRRIVNGDRSAASSCGVIMIADTTAPFPIEKTEERWDTGVF